MASFDVLRFQSNIGSFFGTDIYSFVAAIWIRNVFFSHSDYLSAAREWLEFHFEPDESFSIYFDKSVFDIISYDNVPFADRFVISL